LCLTFYPKFTKSLVLSGCSSLPNFCVPILILFELVILAYLGVLGNHKVFNPISQVEPLSSISNSLLVVSVLKVLSAFSLYIRPHSLYSSFHVV